MSELYAYTIGSKRVEEGIDIRLLVPWVEVPQLWDGRATFAVLAPMQSAIVLDDGRVCDVGLGDCWRLLEAEGIDVYGRYVDAIDWIAKDGEHPAVLIHASSITGNPTAGIRGIIHVWTGGDSPWFFCYFFGRVGQRAPFYINQYKSAKVAVANIMADNK